MIPTGKTHDVDLADLIQTAKGGRSYDQLSADCGGRPGRQRLQQLATQRLKNFPDPDTIVALSRGLGVSQRSIVLASADSLGLDVIAGESRLETLLPASVRDLTPEQVGAVIQTIKTMAGIESARNKPVKALPKYTAAPEDHSTDPDEQELGMAAAPDPYSTDAGDAIAAQQDADAEREQ